MGLWSASNSFSLRLLPPHTIFLLQCEFPHTGYSPSQTPAQILSMGNSHSGMDCSSVGSPWNHNSCQKTCPCMGSSPRTKLLPEASSGVHSAQATRDSAPAVPGAPSTPPSSLTLVSEGFSHTFFSLSSPNCCTAFHPFLPGLSQKHISTVGLHCALCCVHCHRAAMASVWHRGCLCGTPLSAP